MTEASGEVEDEVIDLNKEPVTFERKRKRGEKTNSTDKGNGASDALLQSGRVLRSRTVAMSDGEKQVIKMEIVKMGDKDDGQVPEEEESKAPVLRGRKKKKGRRGRPPKTEAKVGERSRTVSTSDGEKQAIKMETVEGQVPEDEESKAPVLRRRKKKKGRRGRPPKTETKIEESLMGRKKGRRGRPPKMEGKCGVSSVNYRKKDDNVMEQKMVDGRSNGAGLGRGRRKLKRKRGRPPKTENVNVEFVIKDVKRNMDHKKSENGRPMKKLKVGTNDLENGVVKQKKRAVESAEGKEMGLREQKQLVRDQIVAMLKKAGWSVEHRQRQWKEYHDAVYIDRDGKTHWSVTLAYRKFKEKIDKGKGDDRDISAFSPIPAETLSMLFRITEKGKKAGKKKNGVVKIINRVKKKASFKSKSLDGTTKSKLNRGKQRTLLARRPTDGSDDGSYELYEGKRSLLSWMIDLGAVPLGGKVKYKRGRGRRILLEGRITKEGICCDCCNITHTIREFESHAGSAPGNPYQHTYLDSGNSLFQCLVDSWKKHMETDNIGFVRVDVEGDDPNDDTCNVCGDGGDLICCDSCPSTFHNGCLRINVPSGDWNCVYCSCKFCGVACGSILTSDDDSDLSSELFTCRLCDEKFHAHCIKEEVAEDFDDEGPFFCGKECLKILEQLQVLFGVRHELEDGFSYTVLQHRVVGSDGDSSKVESNSKLAVAFTVMDECFEPIIDERSGTNMIHNVVYSCGSNVRRLNYDGFFTIILEKDDDLISAASIRIHGSQLAEMPFIGTRFIYRRQGMCSRLLTAIEKVLSSLGVEKLVIPAISELNETWTKVFGFSPLEESKRHEMRYMSMIVFPGVDMLQKPLVGQTDSAATGCTNVATEHHNRQENPNVPEEAVTVKLSPGAYDASTTESMEVQTHNQNTKEEQSDDIRGVAALNSDISPEIEIHNSDRDAAVEVNVPKSTEVQTHNQDTEEKPSEDIRGVAALSSDISPEIEIHNIDKDAAVEVNIPESTEVRTPDQNTEVKPSDDIRGVAALNSDISPEIEIHNNDKDAAVEVNIPESTEVQAHNQNTREKPSEDIREVASLNSDISPEIEIHNNDKDAAVEVNIPESTEVQAHNQNTKEKPSEDIREVAALNSDISPEIEIHNNKNDVTLEVKIPNACDTAATESTKAQTHNQNIRQEQSEDIRGVALSNSGISPEIETRNNDKDAVEVNVDETCCHNNLETSEGNDLSLTADETDTRPNGILSENGEIVKIDILENLEK